VRRSTIADVGRLAMELREDTYLSAQGHFCVANRWAGYHLGLGISSTLLSVFAGASIISGTEQLELLAGLIALAVSSLTALTTFLNPNEHSLTHYNVGTSYLVFSNHARIFYQIRFTLREKPDLDLIQEFYDLAGQRDELNKNSLRIPEWALKKAKKFTDENLGSELDQWAPRF